MVTKTPAYPGNASVYELLRTHPAARAKLAEMGVTTELLGYKIGDAARVVGVPVERLTEAAAAPE